MIILEKTYLEHYGVQGMKWGVRKAANKASRASLQKKGLSKRQAKKTVRYQNLVDMQRMAASGRRGKVSVVKQMQNRATSNMSLSLLTIAKHPLSTQKAAKTQLSKNTAIQKKSAAGKKSLTATLLKIQGVKLSEIDFSLDE